MVEVITDNKNRTYQEVRKLFSDHGGNLGSPGAAAWMFLHRGVIRIAGTGDEIEMKAIDAGAEDLTKEDEGTTIYTKPEELKSTEENLRTAGLAPEYAGLEWVPKEKITPPSETQSQLEALEDALDEIADVSEYYTNTAV